MIGPDRLNRKIGVGMIIQLARDIGVVYVRCGSAPSASTERRLNVPEKPWKLAEREVADLVGGYRVTSKGIDAPDVVCDTLVLKVRLRKELPQWIVEGVEEARRLTPRFKLGGMVIVQGETGDKYLILRLSDYLDWHQGKKPEP